MNQAPVTPKRRLRNYLAYAVLALVTGSEYKRRVDEFLARYLRVK